MESDDEIVCRLAGWSLNGVRAPTAVARGWEGVYVVVADECLVHARSCGCLGTSRDFDSGRRRARSTPDETGLAHLYQHDRHAGLRVGEELERVAVHRVSDRAVR